MYTFPYFTFQYVSINTINEAYKQFQNFTLHSNMFLLIRWFCCEPAWTHSPLHSNMFLLIRELAR